MKQEIEPDIRRTPLLRFILNDDFSSFALCTFVFGLILLPLLVLAWPDYVLAIAVIGLPLMILIPAVLVVWRFRIVGSLVANGVDIRARIEKVVLSAMSPYTSGTPPMLEVTLSYDYLGEIYKSRFNESAPTKFASLKAGEEITVSIDPRRPKRYQVRDRQYPRLGRSKVVHP